MSLPSIFFSSIFPSIPPQPSSPEKPSSAASGGGGVAGVRMPRKKTPSPDKENSSDRFLTSGIPGGRSQQAMRKILKGLSFLRKTTPQPPPHPKSASADFQILNSLDAISPRREEPWARAEEEGAAVPRVKKKRSLPAAESVLAAGELGRMREEARGMKRWVRGKKAGVTSEVVEGIRREWRRSELAMVKVVYPLRGDMVRAHEIVEVCGDFVCFLSHLVKLVRQMRFVGFCVVSSVSAYIRHVGGFDIM